MMRQAISCAAVALLLALPQHGHGHPSPSLDSRQESQEEIEIDDLVWHGPALRIAADAPLTEFRAIHLDDIVVNTTESTPGGPGDAGLEKRFINGADDRHLWTDGNYPFHSVGRIQWSTGAVCSGTLIGPRHVLTATHCLPSGPASGVFAPGYDNGPRFGQAQITFAGFATGYPDGPCTVKFDWAVLILDQRLGDQLNWFGVKLPDHNRLDTAEFYHMGYPGDLYNTLRPIRQLGISVISSQPNFDCDSTGPFYTDTDAAGGQSGGPHWELDSNSNRWIWGTLSRSYTFIGTNIAWAGWGSGSEMIQVINNLRQQFP